MITESQRKANKKYKEKNKERISKYNKEYYEKNRESIVEKRRQFKENNLEEYKKRRHEEYLRRKEAMRNGESANRKEEQ